jgi:hypothetical protein
MAKEERMNDYPTDFYGQHEDEKVLYKVKSHPLAEQMKYARVVVATLVVLIGVIVIAQVVPELATPVAFWGLVMALLIMVVGFWFIRITGEKSAAYITDRRVVRFSAVSPFAVNTRSLSWDEAVKVKTYAPNVFWKILNAGNVVVHAKSTVLTTEEIRAKSTVTEDDVELTDVYYYEDLGNYIEKILFTYRKKPEEMEKLRKFVPKPKGKRY